MATIVRAGGVPATGNAGYGDVLAGKTFSNDNGTDLTGAMQDLGYEPEASGVSNYQGFIYLYTPNHDYATHKALISGIKASPANIASGSGGLLYTKEQYEAHDIQHTTNLNIWARWYGGEKGFQIFINGVEVGYTGPTGQNKTVADYKVTL